MNPSSCCNPCSDDPQVVNVPGVEGEPGTNGADGADGKNAFTVTLADFVVPALGGTVSGVIVADSEWMVEGQYVFVQGAGVFTVQAVTDSTHVNLTYPDYSININSGVTIAAGAGVSPSGNQITVSGITDLTDNTTGTASDVLAAGSGIQTLAFYIEAAAIANGDLLTTYVPGFRFKILKVDARCAKPVTTGAKASNINLEIGTTDLTGGVVALAGTYIQGAAQAGTTVSGANVGSATDSFSIEASGTTAFIEGAFWILVEIQNMDSADAFAAIADKLNDILAALAP